MATRIVPSVLSNPKKLGKKLKYDRCAAAQIFISQCSIQSSEIILHVFFQESDTLYMILLGVRSLVLCVAFASMWSLQAVGKH